jgi:hypothetical protein
VAGLRRSETAGSSALVAEIVIAGLIWWVSGVVPGNRFLQLVVERERDLVLPWPMPPR